MADTRELERAELHQPSWRIPNDLRSFMVNIPHAASHQPDNLEEV